MKTTTLELRGGRRSRHRRGCKVVGHAIVLDDAFTRDTLAKISWHMTAKGYPAMMVRTADGKRGIAYLHKFVYEHYHGLIPLGKEIDHEDRNKLNNVPKNLRLVTHSVNGANTPKRRTNTSGYKGVSWHKQIKKWDARIQKAGKQIYLGLFTNIRSAARAVNQDYRKHFPEVSIPNPEAEA